MPTPKRVPQRRNSKAGTTTGKSKSAKYFASNPEQRKKRVEYMREYNATEKEKKRRAELNSLRKKLKPKAGEDVSHTKNGGVVKEDRSKNRARNGKNGRSTKK